MKYGLRSELIAAIERQKPQYHGVYLGHHTTWSNTARSDCSVRGPPAEAPAAVHGACLEAVLSVATLLLRCCCAVAAVFA